MLCSYTTPDYNSYEFVCRVSLSGTGIAVAKKQGPTTVIELVLRRVCDAPATNAPLPNGGRSRFNLKETRSKQEFACGGGAAIDGDNATRGNKRQVTFRDGVDRRFAAGDELRDGDDEQNPHQETMEAIFERRHWQNIAARDN